MVAAFGVPEKVDFDVAVSAEHGASSVAEVPTLEAMTISRIAFSVPTQFKKYEDRSEPEDPHPGRNRRVGGRDRP
jgi:hypothetical protein